MSDTIRAPESSIASPAVAQPASASPTSLDATKMMLFEASKKSAGAAYLL